VRLKVNFFKLIKHNLFNILHSVARQIYPKIYKVKMYFILKVKNKNKTTLLLQINNRKIYGDFFLHVIPFYKICKI